MTSFSWLFKNLVWLCYDMKISTGCHLLLWHFPAGFSLFLLPIVGNTAAKFICYWSLCVKVHQSWTWCERRIYGSKASPLQENQLKTEMLLKWIKLNAGVNGGLKQPQTPFMTIKAVTDCSLDDCCLMLTNDKISMLQILYNTIKTW